MKLNIDCPNCGKAVDVQAAQLRYCPHCQVDLAIAAELAEQEMDLSAVSGRLEAGLQVAPEILAPRLGEHLVQMGLLQPAGLERALAYQAERSRAGEPVLLGQALRELGLISHEALDQAVTVQIVNLQKALRQSNRGLEARVEERTRQLEQAYARLAELSQLKANFIANISHELRTPLTHLKGYLELMISGDLGALDTAQSEALQVMKKAQVRLERLIEDLLQFSLVSRGKLTLNSGVVEVAAMLQRARMLVAARTFNAAVVIQEELPVGLPPVLCDAEKITWVLAQLLDNAVKFTPQGGSIKIEAHHAQTFVTIAVKDTGIGIPEDRLEEIFEPFHQLDGSATRRYGGTGLGLALSNQILKAHDTRLRVISAPGAGAHFEFDLPAHGVLAEN